MAVKGRTGIFGICDIKYAKKKTDNKRVIAKEQGVILMKNSEKLSLAVSVILFVFSALFSIALLSQLFSPGAGAFTSLGALLISAYGLASALIPLFLLVAGILSLIPTWSIRRWLLLASSIVPFFTIIVTEKLCIRFSADGDLLGAVKIGFAVICCILFLILEYLCCCIAADSLDKWISDHFGDDSEEGEGKVEKSAVTSQIDSLSAQAEKESEQAKIEEEKESQSSEEEKTEESVELDASDFKADAETEKSDESEETVKAEETVAEPQMETTGATTAMFAISEDEIERAREAEKEELAKEAEKKKLSQTEPTVVASMEETVVASTPISSEDDSFVIMPVAEDEAAFITDESPITQDVTQEPSRAVIDLSKTQDIFQGEYTEQNYPPSYEEENVVEKPIEEKKTSVFDRAIEEVDERARQNQYIPQENNTLDEDFFDIDMNAEDEDERAEREEREREMFAFEDRPLVMEKVEPIIVGEYSKSVSEPLNSVFEKMDRDIQENIPPIELPETAKIEKPSVEDAQEEKERAAEDVAESRPSLLQTAMHMKDALEEKVVEKQSEKIIEDVSNKADEEHSSSESAPEKTIESAEQSENKEATAEPIIEPVNNADESAERSEEEQITQESAVESSEPVLESESEGALQVEEGESEGTEPIAQTQAEPVIEEPITEESTSEPVIEQEETAVEEEEKDEPVIEESEKEESEEVSQQEQKESVPPVILPPEPKPVVRRPYAIPTDILTAYSANPYWEIDEETKQAAENLTNTLREFKIDAEVTGIRKGPVVTMFEMLPAPGVKLSKIVALQDNIALRLAAKSVRIVAPIPGKRAVGIEVPNKERAVVSFREIIEEDNPAWSKMAVPVVLGKDISGESKIMDLVKTPHLLIAGATGAGKSVCVNSLILSVLFKRSPEQVRLILIDPKIVELKLYNDIPHLLTPVITEPKRAFQALQYCLCEMERRYALLDGMQVRDIESYNRRIVERNIATEKLPYIVVIIDEFADLMATSGKELETTVARLCAMSRAVGIHLVLATQRPSIDVITGLIKANIPSRIAFMVASKMDSRIIIDQIGAEKLLGKGDMLYAGVVDPFPTRIQGTLVNDLEVENVVDYVKQFGEPDYIDDEIFIDDDDDEESEPSYQSEGEDPLYDKALDIVIQAGKASASYIQRRLKIGYNRAARLVEEMEARGIVGPANGSKPREIIHMP